MQKISKRDFFLVVLKKGLLKKLLPLKLMLSVPTESKFIKVVQDGYTIAVEDIIYFVQTDIKLPLFTPEEEVLLPKDSLSILDKDIKTTYGRAIINYLLLEHGLDGKVGYINEMFTAGDIEKKYIIPNLVNDDANPEGKVQVKLYKKFANVVFYLRNLTDVLVIPATEKSLLPPKDLQARKIALAKEYDVKYSKEWKTNKVLALQFDEALMTYYKEYLKDDPTYGITTSGKIVDASLKRRFVSMGNASTVDTDKDATYIIESLSEGYPNKKKEIAAIINNLIYGSYARGLETQVGGVIAKQLLRAMHGYSITINDCKTTDYVDFLVTKKVKSSLIGLYYFVGTSSVLIDSENIDKLEGKNIKLRNAMYCKAKGSTLCKLCAGKQLSKIENGPALYAIMLGGKALKNSLAKFHTVDLRLIKISISDLI